MCTMVPVGKIPLKINMDETSICLHQGSGKGTIFIDKKRPQPPFQYSTTGKRRCCFTHVGFICDRPEVQRVLPQVLIANESTVPAGRLNELRAACPDNVFVLRQTSAWNNAFLCAWIIRVLAAALAPFTGAMQPILLLDAVRIHTAPCVLAACFRRGVWPLVIPARVTWLIQPLDVDVFFLYKLALRKAYRVTRAAAEGGEVDIGAFLACVYEAVRRVLERDQGWATAFDRTGFSRRQTGVSETVRRAIEVEGCLDAGSNWPTAAQFESCFPRRAVVPHADLWRPFKPARTGPCRLPPLLD